MEVYDCTSHLDFLRYLMAKHNSGRSHGSVKRLAAALNCHSTFVSQVLHDKASLSSDQAIRLCHHFELNHDSTQFFINLLSRDRVGTSEGKDFFQALIDQQLENRKVFQKRTQLKISLTRDQEVAYLSSWVPATVHAALHLERLQSVKALAKSLGLSLASVRSNLEKLRKLGLATKKRERWIPLDNTLHLSRESPLAASYHGQWRLRTSAQLSSEPRDLNHTHFSSVFAIDQRSADQIREILLKNMDTIRKKMVEASPEILYCFCMDFYPMNLDR